MAIGWQADTWLVPGSTRIPRSAHEAITASRLGLAFGQSDSDSAALRHKDTTGSVDLTGAWVSIRCPDTGLRRWRQAIKAQRVNRDPEPAPGSCPEEHRHQW